MLIHEALLQQIKEKKFDTDRAAVEHFCKWGLADERSGEMWFEPAPDSIDSVHQPHPAKLADADWTVWQRNSRALRWLADRKRSKSVEPPGFVREALAETIERMRPRFSYPSKLVLDPVNRTGQLARYRGRVGLTFFNGFDDLDTFWQCIFCSLLLPDAVRIAGVCSKCGQPLMTGSGKPSKRTMCVACTAMKWQETNKDRHRKYQREYVAKRRASQKRKKK